MIPARNNSISNGSSLAKSQTANAKPMLIAAIAKKKNKENKFEPLLS